MQSIDPALAAYRSARQGTHAETLVWVTAKNRGTGADETMGLWTGADHQAFTIGGVSRTYYGAGNVLDVPDIVAGTGLEVRTSSVGLSAISPEVEQLIRGYDVRQARVEIHLAEYNRAGQLIAAPLRVFKGWVDGAPIITPEIGGQASATLNLVSNARMLTRHAAGTKSDEVQKRRSGDRARRYGSVAGEVEVVWGAEKIKNSEPMRDAGDRGVRR